MPLSNVPFTGIGVEKYQGVSVDPAGIGHQHSLLDQGQALTLESPWENLQGTLTVYKSGDWCLLEGVLYTNGNLAPQDVDTVSIMTLDYRPVYRQYFLAGSFEDRPGGSSFVDVEIREDGQIIVSDPGVIAGTTAVMDRLDLHGINWRIS